jgi:hypothetical protein
VILSFEDSEIVGFKVFQDFDKLKGCSIDTPDPEYPEELIQAVADEMGIEFIEILDI